MTKQKTQTALEIAFKKAVEEKTIANKNAIKSSMNDSKHRVHQIKTKSSKKDESKTNS